MNKRSTNHNILLRTVEADVCFKLDWQLRLCNTKSSVIALKLDLNMLGADGLE